MRDGSIIKTRWAKALLVFGFWTLVGLAFASQYYISMARADNPVTWGHALSWTLADWYVFAVLSFPVIFLARRFRFESATWVRSVAVHGSACLLFSLSYMALRALVAQSQSGLGGQPVSFTAAFKVLLLKTWHFNLLIYWVIVSVSYAFEYYRKFQERELQALELEKRLTEAKLHALRMQLNPHFLFNTLHAISSLMHRDVEAADRMITRLSDLLRLTLESADSQEVPLKQELEALQSYLDIEQIRFGDRLALRWEIAPDTLEARVPNLILQPLVENAIHHGIGPHARAGRIELTAQHEHGRLRLEVRDNGSGLAGNAAPEEGVGLSNTRARLAQLYGPEHRFELANAPAGGLVVRLTIPFLIDQAATGPAIGR
ncbi:MAG: histidine kinase [Verrucomicrobia bacterium]|nr:histidine kinase [Verrucomicrobiota bacterium]